MSLFNKQIESLLHKICLFIETDKHCLTKSSFEHTECIFTPIEGYENIFYAIREGVIIGVKFNISNDIYTNIFIDNSNEYFNENDYLGFNTLSNYFNELLENTTFTPEVSNVINILVSTINDSELLKFSFEEYLDDLVSELNLEYVAVLDELDTENNYVRYHKRNKIIFYPDILETEIGNMTILNICSLYLICSNNSILPDLSNKFIDIQLNNEQITNYNEIFEQINMIYDGNECIVKYKRKSGNNKVQEESFIDFCERVNIMLFVLYDRFCNSCINST